jgi:hypothetical protein
MARRTLKATIVVAVALPMRLAAWIVRWLGATATPGKLRNLTSGIPVAAYVVTGIVWVLQIRSGILYPVFDAGNLRNSWGGPTLAGAWVTHFALGLAILLVVSFPFALWKTTRAKKRTGTG